MSDAEAHAAEGALRQDPPACTVILAHSLCARLWGGAGPPIAVAQTTDQTAVAALRHDGLPCEDAWRACGPVANGAKPEEQAQPSRVDDATDDASGSRRRARTPPTAAPKQVHAKRKASQARAKAAEAQGTRTPEPTARPRPGRRGQGGARADAGALIEGGVLRGPRRSRAAK